MRVVLKIKVANFVLPAEGIPGGTRGHPVEWMPEQPSDRKTIGSLFSFDDHCSEMESGPLDDGPSLKWLTQFSHEKQVIESNEQFSLFLTG